MKKDFEWFKNKTAYQIWPRSFCDGNDDGIGDIIGIISKLPYLHELGVELIWLSPVYKSPMDDMGYDISDYYTIDPIFGTNEDMYQLIAEAKRYNIGIIMDLVVNHTSDEHPWFIEAKKSKTNPYRDYYIWQDPINNKPPTDQRSFFLPSAWSYHEDTKQYYYHAFSNKQPDLNWNNPKIIEEVCTIMNFWLSKGIVGFRMDVIELIGKIPLEKKFTSPKVHELLRKLFKYTLGNIEKTISVGETGGATVEDAKLYSGNQNELDMVFGFEHMAVDEIKGRGKWYLKDLDLIEFKKIIAKWQIGLHNCGWNSLYLSNHDQPRPISRFIKDQSYREVGAKMLANMLHMLCGTPYIYQGEEIGMTNYHFKSPQEFKDIEMINFYNEFINDPQWGHNKIMTALNAKGRDNARTPVQWSKDINAGFSKSTPWINVNSNYMTINVVDALANKNSIWYFYQKLIQLRKKLPIIRYGDFKLLEEDNPDIFIYLRTYKTQKLLVIASFTNKNITVKLPIEFVSDKTTILVSNYEVNDISSNMVLEPYATITLLTI